MYYGAALAKLGQAAAAVDALRRVVTLRPDQVSGYCDLAAALAESGRRDEALDAMDQAAALDAAHPAVRALRARLAPPTPPPAPTAARPPAPAPTRGRRRRRAVPRTARRAGRRWAWPKLRLRGLINDANRLPIMLVVLGILVLLTILKSVKAPGQDSHQAEQAVALLTQAERDQADMAQQRGESFEVQRGVRARLEKAEAIARRLEMDNADRATVAYLQARAELLNKDPAGARQRVEEALAALGEETGERPRPGGLSPDALRAGLLRARARATLFTRPLSAEQLAAARADLTAAQQIAADDDDKGIEAVLASGDRKR